MKKFKRIYFYVALCAFLFLQGEVFAEAKRQVVLKWEPVPTAISYVVEIQDSEGNLLLKQETPENKVKIELIPGEYKRKISVINKLGEQESESDWKDFLVQVVAGPEILGKEVFTANKTNSGRMNVRGKNFHPSMVVKLRKGEKIYILEQSKVSDSENLELVVNPEIPEGDYDLILENPGKVKEFSSRIQKEKFSDLAVERKQLKPWEVVKRSAVIPGWGEYYAGQVLENPAYDLRGKIYFGSFLGLTMLYLYFNEFTLLPSQETPTEKKFKEDSTRNLTIAFALPNLSNNSRRLAAVYGLNEMNNQAELVNQQSQRVNIILFAMAGVYITQLIDAFLIEKREIAPSIQSLMYPKFDFSATRKATENFGTEEHLKIRFHFYF